MTVAIVTDSAAALPADLAARSGIAVVPMWLTLDGAVGPRGRRSRSPNCSTQPDVTTSGPTPGEFEAADRGRSRHERRRRAACCTIAATMSSTYEAAVIGARDDRFGVRVVDTGDGGGRAGARGARGGRVRRQRGGTLDEVEAAARAAVATGAARRDGTEPRSSRAERPGPGPRGLGRPAARARAAVRVPGRRGARDAAGARGSTRRSSAWWRAGAATRGRRRALQVVALHAQPRKPREKLLARSRSELATRDRVRRLVRCR